MHKLQLENITFLNRRIKFWILVSFPSYKVLYYSFTHYLPQNPLDQVHIIVLNNFLQFGFIKCSILYFICIIFWFINGYLTSRSLVNSKTFFRKIREVRFFKHSLHLRFKSYGLLNIIPIQSIPHLSFIRFSYLTRFHFNTLVVSVIVRRY